MALILKLDLIISCIEQCQQKLRVGSREIVLDKDLTKDYVESQWTTEFDTERGLRGFKEDHVELASYVEQLQGLFL